jgi:hypothetical protein
MWNTETLDHNLGGKARNMINRCNWTLLLAIITGHCTNAYAVTYHSTGDTGADCTNCGPWPWSSACRWGDPESHQIGFYREYEGTRGSASCHHDVNPLPHSEQVTFTMGDEQTFTLQAQGEWDWFGLTASASTSITSSHSVTATNLCNQSGCCLQPLKAFVRWEYHRKQRKLQIAKVWFAYGGTSVTHYSAYEDCVSCDPSTRIYGTLHQFPTPELLPAQQAVNLPYEPLLNNCGGQ